MRLKCAALNCTNNRRVCPDKSFFRFPKDGNRCRQWVINAGRMDLLKKNPSSLYASRCICSDHFEEAMFMNRDKRNSLVWNALPTKFDFNAPSGKCFIASKTSVKRTNCNETRAANSVTEDLLDYSNIFDILEVSMTEDQHDLTFSDVSYRLEKQSCHSYQQRSSTEGGPMSIHSLKALPTVRKGNDCLDSRVLTSPAVQEAAGRDARTKLRTSISNTKK